MKPKLLAALMVLVMVLAGAMIIRSSKIRNRTTNDFPEGMHWECADCGHGFSTTRKEFSAWAAENDERLPCPECGENFTEVARLCPLPDCGAYHAEPNIVIDGNVCCPVCRKPIP